MQTGSVPDISKFFVAGINYKKSDAACRSAFAVNKEQYTSAIEHCATFNISELMIVSTCNRTELYGYTESADNLANLLCEITGQRMREFSALAYFKQGKAAVEHLFFVGAGLDSQILGDYEIVGQIKQSARFARENGMANIFIERLVNQVLQASKAIKNKTELSGGTVSVSFAATQFIRDSFSDTSDKQIVLLGTGKIGRITCRNLKDYLGTNHITLINRTESKAEELAAATGLRHASIEQLPSALASADIIIVATGAHEPVVMRHHVEGQGAKLIIDLSIPFNVEKSVAFVPAIRLVNVDDLSRLKDETLARRKASVPQAKCIIKEHIEQFLEWYQMRKYVPVLRAVKSRLQQLPECPLYIRMYPQKPAQLQTEQKIQRVINGLASRIREQNSQGCHYIQAINEFLATGSS